MKKSKETHTSTLAVLRNGANRRGAGGGRLAAGGRRLAARARGRRLGSAGAVNGGWWRNDGPAMVGYVSRTTLPAGST